MRGQVQQKHIEDKFFKGAVNFQYCTVQYDTSALPYNASDVMREGEYMMNVKPLFM